MINFIEAAIIVYFVAYVTALDFTDVAVQEHNKYRRLHGVSDVASFNTDINEFAQNWADYLASTNQFDHSDGPYGENLYIAWGRSHDKNVIMADAIKTWYEEIEFYDWRNPEYSNIQTSHFTQVVWESSTEIGVGISTAPDETYGSRTVVCINYRPPGNYGGEFEENVLPLVSSGTSSVHQFAVQFHLLSCLDRFLRSCVIESLRYFNKKIQFVV